MTAIVRAVLSMSALNALSRATGYLRAMVMAAVLGTGVVANAYGVSNGIANLIYELFLGGILYSAFVPLLIERITRHGEEDARHLTNAILTLVLPLLTAVAVLGIVFAEPLVDLMTRFQPSTGLSEEGAQLSLLAATTLSVALMAVVLVPSAWRLGYRPRPVFGPPALLPAAKLALPVLLFTAGSLGVQYVGGTLLGSSFAAVPQLYFAFTVFSLPYGVFVIAIETATMPELSERYAREDEEGYRDTLSFGLRTMAFIIVPSSVVLVALATPIVGLLYERGEFGPEDTWLVASILAAYSVGLLAYAAYFLLVRAFYSRRNTKMPALLNICLFGLYAPAAYAFSGIFGVVGVALALSAVNAVFAALALAAMRREIGAVGGRR